MIASQLLRILHLCMCVCMCACVCMITVPLVEVHLHFALLKQPFLYFGPPLRDHSFKNGFIVLLLLTITRRCHSETFQISKPRIQIHSSRYTKSKKERKLIDLGFSHTTTPFFSLQFFEEWAVFFVFYAPFVHCALITAVLLRRLRSCLNSFYYVPLHLFLLPSFWCLLPKKKTKKKRKK